MMKITKADSVYYTILNSVYNFGVELETRNHRVKSMIALGTYFFDQCPLVTVRKTAYMKALREMEWFMSGNDKCPDELLDWWDGQLNHCGYYINGYATQFRRHSGYYDQVEFILNGLISNPNSRRLVMTAWHPGNMENITQSNNNKDCPTTCHSTIIQFFVRNKYLFMSCYQRSADVLLGLPHNFVQSWGMLMYFAHHANLNVGGMYYTIGDAHIYLHKSHTDVVENIISYCERDSLLNNVVDNSFELCYNPSVKTDRGSFNGFVPNFLAMDFSMTGKIPYAIIQSQRPIRF